MWYGLIILHSIFDKFWARKVVKGNFCIKVDISHNFDRLLSPLLLYFSFLSSILPLFSLSFIYYHSYFTFLFSLHFTLLLYVYFVLSLFYSPSLSIFCSVFLPCFLCILFSFSIYLNSFISHSFTVFCFISLFLYR